MGSANSSGCDGSVCLSPEAERGYFWGAPTSPINWCELDHSESEQIAEYWNTLTNLGYVLVGLRALQVGWTNNRARPTNTKAIFPFTYFLATVAVVLTGVFSGVFHASLKWQTQKLDEIFENISLIALFHSFQKPRLMLVIWHCLICSLGIWCISEGFAEVHLISVIVLTILRVRQVAILCELDPSWIRYFLSKIVLFAIIGGLSWLLDRLCCDFWLSNQHGIPNPQLHAFGWHVFTALALNEGLMCFGVLHYLELVQSMDPKGQIELKLKSSLDTPSHQTFVDKSNTCLIQDFLILTVGLSFGPPK